MPGRTLVGSAGFSFARVGGKALSMRFEPARSSDLDVLHALIHRAYRGESAKAGWTHEADLLDGQRTDPEALAAMLDSGADTILVARDEDGLAGCIAVTVKSGGLAYIGMVTVDPTRQAGGLGRQLLAVAERCASMQGASVAEMTVIAQRSELIAWYERRGYRLTGERRPFPMKDPRFGVPRRDDLEFVVLAKPLNSSGSSLPSSPIG
jgi:GNAT superfamily N-acetyltransferase